MGRKLSHIIPSKRVSRKEALRKSRNILLKAEKERRDNAGLTFPIIPNWDDFFLDLAETYAHRAQCLRRQYAALIVNDRHKLISAGYNGSPRLCSSSLDKKSCYREQHNIASGSNYELCRSIHAEINAISQIGLNACKDTVMYLHGWDVQKQMIAGNNTLGSPPCLMCLKMIVQAEIKEVILRLPCGAIRRITMQEMVDKINQDDFRYPY